MRSNWTAARRCHVAVLSAAAAASEVFLAADRAEQMVKFGGIRAHGVRAADGLQWEAAEIGRAHV